MSSINPNINQVLKGQSFSIKSLDYYVDGIVKDQNFLILSEAITLLESESKEHHKLVDQLLIECAKKDHKTRRIGITGTPGVGKSTFIEHIAIPLGISEQRIAILTVDPSSSDNRGSILGDKTRMNQLSLNDNIFIRPSPSRAHLGGAHAMTYEAIILCEAAGIELIIIETVGVGQSEHEIKGLVDCTLLLLLPGAGDDLQGIKKGITEIADIVVIHKSDGDRLKLAKEIQKDYQLAGHLARAHRANWIIPVHMYSSLNGNGRKELLNSIGEFFKNIRQSGHYEQHRNKQQSSILNRRILTYCGDELNKLLTQHQKINQLLTHQLSSDHSLFEILSKFKNHVKIDIDYK